MGGYSFGIATAHDLYCKLKREYAQFHDPSGIADSDLAWNCALTAWHLRDWLWWQRLSVCPGEDVKLFGLSFGTDRDYYNTELNRRCPKYKLLRDLCNGSKHFHLTNPDMVESTTIRPGAMFGEAMFNEVCPNEGPYLAICLDDGSIVRFGEVLGQVVALWDDVFKNEPCL
jgi:hypothetical protein